MSINTFVGFLAAFGLFIGSIMISADNVLIFISLSSLLMVVGGTLASTFLGQEARYVFIALRGILSTFGVQRVGRSVLNEEVGRIIRWGYVAQQKGVIALESETAQVEGDEFLTFGIELLVTGYSGEEVRDALLTVTDTTFERNMVGPNILKGMGSAAPAFGMIGTLIGLIIMLNSLGDDTSQLGAGLAVALNTTLYGVVLARMVLIPASNKLTQRMQIVRFRQELMCEGMAMLADRKNPRFIQDRMNSYLDPAIRFDIDSQMRG